MGITSVAKPGPRRNVSGVGSVVGFLIFLSLSAFTAEPVRTLWTASRLVGSPEPPSPFTVEKRFGHLEWKNPIYVAPEPGTDWLWVVLQGGEADRPSRVLRLRNEPDAPKPESVLTMAGRLIYGLTFHPGFRTNRQVFVFSNGPTSSGQRTNRISRFNVPADGVSPVDPATESVVMSFFSAGHDGGDLGFGKDGMLYITTGDGSSDSDTYDSGQDMTRLLAKLLRIDVDHAPPGEAYAVPTDNPFVGQAGVRPETWAYGFRNPWRMGVDEQTGDIWVGQNGQDLWETAHLVRRGDNIGWSVYEGSHPFYPQRRRGPTPIVPPTIEHAHSEFRSLTGGVVYYGDELPELNGVYVYGDYSTGRIWGARHRDGKLVWHEELADTTLQIAAFRVDPKGRLLVVDHGGGLYQLVKRKASVVSGNFPIRLSETGLFESTAEHRPAPGLIPYAVVAPAWADGAEAERFMALPGEGRIDYTGSRGWGFPNGAALVQTLWLEGQPGDRASRRRIETRVMLRQEGEWAGYTYRWNEDQTDAVLVPKEGITLERTVKDATGAPRKETWRIPSRTECLTCHSRAVNFVLGPSDVQMPRGTNGNQLAQLIRAQVFKNPPALRIDDPSPRLVNPYDTREDLETRARSYLHVNCSPCHVEAGGGNAKMELEIGRARDGMNLIGARPQHDSFGLANAMLVAPGRPEGSVLMHRVSRRGPGQMPPLVTARVDEVAVALLREWVGGLKPELPFVRDWTLGELLPAWESRDAGGSTVAGRDVFRIVGCLQCHRRGGEGGSVGPDLTGVGRRLDRRALIESILEPSKVIADEYAAFDIERRDGEIFTGRIERDDAREVVVRTGSAVDPLVTIPKSEIAGRRRSAVSNMPMGMVNVLQKEQILDLLAFLAWGE